MTFPAGEADPVRRTIRNRGGNWLAQIGGEHAEHRARAFDIGEILEVLKDSNDKREVRARTRVVTTPMNLGATELLIILMLLAVPAALILGTIWLARRR